MNFKFHDLLNKYCTARIDIKNIGKNNNLIILENNDLNSKVSQPDWFDNDGIGVTIQSFNGNLDLKIKCINEGKFKIWLRGPDIRDIHNNSFPIYIDYTNLSVNGKNIFNKNTLIWHDTPFIFSKDVSDSEIISLHIEWLPFNENSEFNINKSHEQIQVIKQKLAIQEEQINSIPQLSNTTLGFSVLGGRLTYKNWRALSPNRTLIEDLNGYCEHLWFTRYLNHKFHDEDFDIHIISVANAHDNLAYPISGKKVFYSLENLNYGYLEMKFCFDKYALDYVDFAMGYDIIDDSKYLRFPYWMVKHFSPNVTEEEIEKKVAMWNSVNYPKYEDVVAIASHDHWKTRALIDNDINNYAKISYAGKWKNNTQELWKDYNDNKHAFLSKFKFNLCSENILDDAYVTEKIFDAINGDCIPLYAGGGNYLEPKVLNHKAIIRWFGKEKMGFDPDLKEKAIIGSHDVRYPVEWIADDDQNLDAIELFRNLLTDKKSYDEFKDQDKLLDSSTKFIIKTFSELEKHFERLIYS